ncbi:unnamed protein product [Blepharisma stoltei]|uniref:RING-type domain-containing protein n=1 Tax=Blepharisma stoltei TaxID=1481888 RepID=A0AAU9KCF8_9CILI|nr:unnamed protein product [Blepharisma stoltei]
MTSSNLVQPIFALCWFSIYPLELSLVSYFGNVFIIPLLISEYFLYIAMKNTVFYCLKRFLMKPLYEEERNLMWTEKILILVTLSFKEPFSYTSILIWYSISMYLYYMNVISEFCKALFICNLLKNLGLFVFIFSVVSIYIIWGIKYLLSEGSEVSNIIFIESFLIFQMNLTTLYQIKFGIISNFKILLLETFKDFMKSLEFIIFVPVVGYHWFCPVCHVYGCYFLMCFLIKLTKLIKYKISVSAFDYEYKAIIEDDLNENKDDKCCICWSLFVEEESTKLKCGHIIHIECLKMWMIKTFERNCPICTQKFL